MDRIKSCRKTLGRTYVRAAATCKRCPMHETCCKEIDNVERKLAEELENKVNNRMEENEMEEKKNTFFNKAVGKIVDVKNVLVEDIKEHPEYYKGYATAAIGGLAGAVIAHKIIKSGLKKHGYVSIGRTRDDELTMIEYGYTGLLGKHKYLTVTDTNENMAALAERLLCVAKGSITSTTTF